MGLSVNTFGLARSSKQSNLEHKDHCASSTFLYNRSKCLESFNHNPFVCQCSSHSEILSRVENLLKLPASEVIIVLSLLKVQEGVSLMGDQ